jgi:hypothetical protein
MIRMIGGLRKIRGLHFIIIILVNVVFWSGILSVNNGVISQYDFNFPLSNDNFVKSYYPLWNDISSQPNIERLPRLVIYLPYLMLAQVGLEFLLIQKILIISTFTFLSLAMFLFCRSLLHHFNIEVRGHSWISMGCAFILAYSPVSLHFAHSISLLISIAALPLLLYFILTKINSVYFPLLAAAALLLSAAHPFNMVMNIVIGTIFLLLVRMSRKDLRFVLVKTTLTFLSFIVMFSWFLIPYFSNPVSSVQLGREETLEEFIFDVVSDNDPMKIFLLERDQFTYTNTVPPDPFLSSLHYASLAALVGIGFSIFFFKKRDWKMYRVLLMFSAGFVICVIISLGTNGPIGDAYYGLISQSSLGWIFRSALKFQLYQSFFIVSLFAFSIAFIIEKLRKHSLSSIAGIIIITFIFLGSSAYGIYYANTYTFNPIELPSQYFEINNILKGNGTEFKVLYYPPYPDLPTIWSQGQSIPAFEAKSSAVPTYEITRNFNYVKEALYEYPYNTGGLSSSRFYDFLASVGVKYIIFKNDVIFPNYLVPSKYLLEENLMRLDSSADVKQIYAKNGWYLFEILRENSGALNIANSIVVVSQQSDIFNLSSPDQPVMFLNSTKQATSASTANADATQIRMGSNSNNNQSVELEYKRESATKVSAELNSSSGSMLVFAETFDNGWKAYMNGQKVDSVQLNGMINGFPIPMDGKILVSIEYEPQKWVEVGVAIAIVYTLSFVLVTLLRKHIRQRISAVMK